LILVLMKGLFAKDTRSVRMILSVLLNRPRLRISRITIFRCQRLRFLGTGSSATVMTLGSRRRAPVAEVVAVVVLGAGSSSMMEPGAMSPCFGGS